MTSSGTKSSSKGSFGKLQLFCERAMTEQLACLRALDQSRWALKQWATHACRTAALLDNFAVEIQAAFKQTIAAVGEHAKALQMLSQSYSEANDCRIALAAHDQMRSMWESSTMSVQSPSQSGAGSFTNSVTSGTIKKKTDTSAVNPMELLAKGHLGPEVACLVTVLRLHSSTDIVSLAAHLRGLETTLQANVQTHTNQLHALKDNLSKAAAVSGTI